MLWFHDEPKRKLKYDIEAVLLSDDDNWIGINQILSNRLVEQYLADPKSGSCPCFNVGDEFILKRTPQQYDFYHL